MKFVPKGPNDDKPALVQVMAWHRTGDKPLSEPTLTQFTDAFTAALGGDESTPVEFITGCIWLSVSTVNRIYELSGITHVTPFRKYGKHSTGPSTSGQWVRTYSKLFCKSVLTISSYRAQSNEICTYGRVPRGSFPRVRRYGLLYLRTVEYDHFRYHSLHSTQVLLTAKAGSLLLFLLLLLLLLLLLWRHLQCPPAARLHENWIQWTQIMKATSWLWSAETGRCCSIQTWL